MFWEENTVKKNLTDKIFEHCKSVEEYDDCNRCRVITVLLMILLKGKIR
tara:strand:- start:181 stop:327 length:147 start_codon:yes stop_codon:yes gene_type:complete